MQKGRNWHEYNSKSSLGMVLTLLLDEMIKSTADSNAPSFSVFFVVLRSEFDAVKVSSFLGDKPSSSELGLYSESEEPLLQGSLRYRTSNHHKATTRPRSKESGFVYLNSTRQSKERNWWERWQRAKPSWRKRTDKEHPHGCKGGKP